MSRHTISRRRSLSAAILAATALAVVPATHASAYQVFSPDARDAAQVAERHNYVDLRSPDARDAAIKAEKESYVDLRSPDARDSGRIIPDVAPAPVAHKATDGTDWGKIAIAGGALVLALVTLTTALLLTRDKETLRKSRASAASR
jgi:rhodanese-related sulfurtransferase